MKKGIVYILTNPSMPDWVKIGYTDGGTVQDRLNSLNYSSAIPLAFRIYATLAVENPKEVEQSIHTTIDAIDPGIRSIDRRENHRDRIREFFQISPERAYIVLKEFAKSRRCEDSLVLAVPSSEEQKEEELTRSAKVNTTFRKLGIPIGSELQFIKDDSIKCIVHNRENKIMFGGRAMTVSGLASELLGYRVNGYRYFIYEGETLLDRRLQMENEN